MSQSVEVTAVIDQPQQAKTNLLGFSASKLGDFFEQIGEKRFRGVFAGSVGIDRLDWSRFWDGYLIRIWVSIEGGTTAKDQSAAAVVVHRR